MKRNFGLCLIGVLAALGISMSSDSRLAMSAASATYAKDVAPIIQKNCQVCHRPGEVAPMSFMSYKEVRPWARSIREKVVTREMLLRNVWNLSFDPQTNVIDVNVGRLRRKLEDGFDAPVLETIWGTGYRLVAA